MLAAATLAMTLGVAAPARASSATLSVNPFSGGLVTVSVHGVFTMTQAQAQDLLNRGYKVAYRL
jgi:hypothetical protein